MPLVRGSSAPISVQRYERKDRSAGPCPRRATRQHWVSGHCGCPVLRPYEGERQPAFRRASTRQATSHWTHLPEHDLNAVMGKGSAAIFGGRGDMTLAYRNAVCTPVWSRSTARRAASETTT